MKITCPKCGASHSRGAVELVKKSGWTLAIVGALLLALVGCPPSTFAIPRAPTGTQPQPAAPAPSFPDWREATQWDTIRWEKLNARGDWRHPETIRAEVPGGWIYVAGSGTVYVPDPLQWIGPPPVPAATDSKLPWRNQMKAAEIKAKIAEINKRRFALINKQLHEGLAPEELQELERLQTEIDQYVDLIAPLPTEPAP